MKFSDLFLTVTLPSAAMAQSMYMPHDDADYAPFEIMGLSFPPRRMLLEQRRLHHTLPSFVTPFGCEYSSNHDLEAGVLVDQVYCPDWCGDAKDFTLTITSVVKDEDGEELETVADCKLPGCRTCKEDTAGGCPCPRISTFRAVCDAVCLKEADVVTSSPSIAPVASLAPTARPNLRPVAAVLPEEEASDVPSDVPSDMPTAVFGMSETEDDADAPTDETTDVIGTTPDDGGIAEQSPINWLNILMNLIQLLAGFLGGNSGGGSGLAAVLGGGGGDSGGSAPSGGTVTSTIQNTGGVP